MCHSTSPPATRSVTAIAFSIKAQRPIFKWAYHLAFLLGTIRNRDRSEDRSRLDTQIVIDLPPTQQRQAAQDANSYTLAAEGAAVQRALCKASANYVNTSWDLVDACREGKVKLSEVKEADLPEALKLFSAYQVTVQVCRPWGLTG